MDHHLIAKCLADLGPAFFQDLQTGKRYVLSHRDILLSDEAEEYLADALQFALELRHTQAALEMGVIQHVLRRCREIGIQQAFAEYEAKLKD